jgi:hypothetical protein
MRQAVLLRGLQVLEDAPSLRPMRWPATAC